MAQGSKPGEGGQLPATRSPAEIATIRHTRLPAPILSPPPHHDIYSIEDLAQLIFDLRQINPGAKISVKLVAEAGVGTVAAGVIKGGADIVHISGHSGGTGASSPSSTKNCWRPRGRSAWAETQQTLILTACATAPSFERTAACVSGATSSSPRCSAPTSSSLGTAASSPRAALWRAPATPTSCPVGIATQTPSLRAKYTATPKW
ncbi:MAG: glutamate synthase-related protein [Anaerolineae bacterium]